MEHKNAKIIEYFHDEKYISLYCSFLNDIYREDVRTPTHIKEIKRLLSEDNPFFNYASIKNFIVIDNGQVLGHASAIIDKRNGDTGIIGFYDCVENDNLSKMLLDTVINYLKDNNCKIVRGPINLSIWHGYRFIQNLKRDPTLFDPFNKGYYISFWQNYGFKEAEKYVSAVRRDFNYVLPYTEKQYKENLNSGFKIREFNKENLKSELEVIFNLSKQIFEESWNQVNLSFEEFQYIYENIMENIDSYFFEIIETNDRKPVGFTFAIPNLFSPNQLVIKTMGVLKEFQRMNLAATFMYSLHIKAKEKGYNECYYPLIRVGNNISKFPYQGYEIITEYASFEYEI